MYYYTKNKSDFINRDSSIIVDYENRKYIKDNVLPRSYFPYQLDMWEENKFYGLVNDNNKLIMPDERYFDTFTVNNRKITAMLFIKKAFQDMKSYASDFQVLNRFTGDYSKFKELNPASAYVNLNSIYLSYINQVFKIFVSNYVQQLPTQINNFDDFISKIVGFLDIMTLSSPMTRAGFVTSPLCDPKVSGLVLSLETDINHANEYEKYVNYYQNQNIEVIFDLTKRFGFVIDRNAPWRLIADLNSPVMKKYMNSFNITDRADLFKRGYSEINTSELESFKNVILAFYNYYAASFPLSDKQTVKCLQYVNSTTALPILNMEFIQEKYNDSFFNRLYIYCRCRETRLKIDQFQFENIVNTANQLYKFSGVSAMMNYLDTIFIIQEQTRKSEEVLTTNNNFARIVSQLKEKPLLPSYRF